MATPEADQVPPASTGVALPAQPMQPPPKLESEPAAISDHMSENMLHGHVTSNVTHPVSEDTAMVDRPIQSVERDGDESPSSSSNGDGLEGHETILPLENAPPNASLSNRLSAGSSIRLDKDIARLQEVVGETSPTAAQKVLRDNWRHFLFGGGYDRDHITFILRAGLKNSDANVLDRILKDEKVFKAPMLDVVSRKAGVVEKVLHNASFADLSTCVSEEVLEQVVFERIKEVSARKLIEWLAAADRLGYMPDDLVNEEDESVAPNPGPPLSPREATPLLVDSPPFYDVLLAEQEKNLAIQHKQPRPASSHPPVCNDCNATFPTESGYNYHIAKKSCRTEARSKWWCLNCMRSFTTKTGLSYHELNKVCIDYAIAPPTHPNHVQPRALTQTHSIPRPPQHTQAYMSRPIQNVPPPPQPQQIQVLTQPLQSPSVQRPPLHTPVPIARLKSSRGQSTIKDIRQSPGDLSPEKQTELKKALDIAQKKYEDAVKAIPQGISETEKASKLVSLKNGIASKKSQIRKSFGVSLRLREKDKIAKRASFQPEIFITASGSDRNRGTPSKTYPPTNGYTGPAPQSASPYHPLGTWMPDPSHNGVNKFQPPMSDPVRHSLPALTGFHAINQPSSDDTLQSNKRRHSEDHAPSRPSPGILTTRTLLDQRSNTITPQPQPPTGGLALVEVRTENPATKYPPKTLHDGQKQPEGPERPSSANAHSSQFSILKLGLESPEIPGTSKLKNWVKPKPNDVVTIDSDSGEEKISPTSRENSRNTIVRSPGDGVDVNMNDMGSVLVRGNMVGREERE